MWMPRRARVLYSVQDAHGRIASVRDEHSSARLIHCARDRASAYAKRALGVSIAGIEHADRVTVLVDDEDAPSLGIYQESCRMLTHGDRPSQGSRRRVQDADRVILVHYEQAPGGAINRQKRRRWPHLDRREQGARESIQHTDAAG